MERSEVEQQLFQEMKDARREYERLAAMISEDDAVIRATLGTADGTLAAAQSANHAKELRRAVERYYVALTKLTDLLTDGKASEGRPEIP